MDIKCTGCQALYWASRSSAKAPQDCMASYESCCKHGKANVEAMGPLPEPLNAFMTRDDARSRAF